jgi:hypothetical protein
VASCNPIGYVGSCRSPPVWWLHCCSDKRQNPEAEYISNVVVLRIDGMLSFLNAEVGVRRRA